MATEKYDNFIIVSEKETFTYEQWVAYQGGDLIEDALIRVGVEIARFVEDNNLVGLENPQFTITITGAQSCHKQ